ncbi:class I SAM-dependent methyltransferase [Streptomyces sp. NPDC002120]|uniref:class I SAM-dependent methyltransferase n=1 Tax=Streptomyces sp. NPDC002120 TaxID=3364631 RepID=UPI0036C3DA4B
MEDVLAWDVWGRDRPGRREVNAAGESTWFNWTMSPDWGPGVEVLGEVGPGTRILELGCGGGGNLAHVATFGAEAVGVDMSTVQLKQAQERWPGLEVWHERAERFLSAVPAPYDVIYSVYGAAWFTEPDVLLPLVLEKLTPGGLYAFSHNPPALTGCYGPQVTQMKPERPGDDPLFVKRFDYEPEYWELLLKSAGFVDIEAAVIAPPDGKRLGTLLVTAHAPS